MSRSRKKPIIKDKGYKKSLYWQTIRSHHKQQLRVDWDNPDLYFKNPKSIINDWDYCDWWSEIYIRKRVFYTYRGWVDWSITQQDVDKASRK